MNMGSYNCRKLSFFLKILSEENRLRLLKELSKKENCVCDLVKSTKLSQSLISHHIADLKDFGLIKGREVVGPRTYYSLTRKGQKVVQILGEVEV
jgi:ArsR family transcriptional regulator